MKETTKIERRIIMRNFNLMNISAGAVAAAVSGKIIDRGINLLPVSTTTKTVVTIAGRIVATKIGVDFGNMVEQQVNAYMDRKENGYYVDSKGKFWIRVE